MLKTRFRRIASEKELVLVLADLLPIALASKRLFDALLFAWFQIEGVALDLLDDVFRLNFTFEATQGIFERFTFLNSNLCHVGNTPLNRAG